MSDEMLAGSIGTAQNAANDFLSAVGGVQVQLLTENIALKTELVWVKAQLQMAQASLAATKRQLSDCEASKSSGINPVGSEDTAAALRGDDLLFIRHLDTLLYPSIVYQSVTIPLL